MNKHKEFYSFIERELVDEKERVSLKQLGYYIKNGESYYSPKRFSITELKYFILELINSSLNQDMTIKEVREMINEYESLYDIYDVSDYPEAGGDVYLSEGIYLRADGSSYDDRIDND